MAKLSDIKNSGSLKIFTYGSSGSGKTCFAASFPSPIYFFDFDGKISSAGSYLKSISSTAGNLIEYDEYLTGDPVSITRFEKKLSELEKACAYKTVVLDSVTLLSESLLKHIVRTQPGIKRVLPNIPVLQDYLINGVEFKSIISRVLSLPCNIVCTGHIDTDKDETTGAIMTKPLLSGKLANEIPIRFQEVYNQVKQMKDGKVEYLLTTQSDSRVQTRTQIAGLPALVRADYSELAKYIEGKI